jgi:hypothetical protein
MAASNKYRWRIELLSLEALFVISVGCPHSPYSASPVTGLNVEAVSQNGVREVRKEAMLRGCEGSVGCVDLTFVREIPYG